MCRKALAVILSLLSAHVACGQERPEAPHEDGGRPAALAHALMDAQDRLTTGDAAAKARVVELSEELARKFRAFDVNVWRRPWNVQAVVAYTLSGGQPRVLRSIVQAGVIPAESASLAEGALAYAEGRQDKAKALLGPIDAGQTSAAVAGLLSLAQAALIAKEDPKAAAVLLDKAGVYAPGSLVEEAALRRSVLLAYETLDFNRFVTTSSRYFRRFGKSFYAEEFRRRFGESIGRFGLSEEPEQKRRLSQLLLEIEGPYRVELYLSMAQYALYLGRLDTARSAAEKALAAQSAAAASRASLYVGAAKILSGDVERGMDDLSRSDDAALPNKDRVLKSAVVRIAGQLVSDPPISDAELQAKAQAGSNAEATPLDRRAELALAQTDDLLRRSIK